MYLLLLLFLSPVSSCPDSCTCSEDPEYDGGVMVDCENTGLSEVPLGIPSHVTTLLLNNNNLRTLEDLSYYNNLRSLELQHNYIERLDSKAFQGLLYLKILVLSENQIEVLPDRLFYGLTYLEWVDLRSNKISQLSLNTFYKAPNINYLNLMDNKISRIPRGSLLQLTGHNIWLLLGNNSLSEIPPDITEMKGLQYLSLKSNSLSYISPGALSKHTNLRTLDISNNNIHYLHNGIFDGIRLQKLVTQGNPWQCDCYLEWLRIYLQTREVECSLRCAGPGEKRQKLLSQIKTSLLCTSPVVAVPEPEHTVAEHSSLTLTCLAKGDPAPKVDWYKDGQEISAQGNRHEEIKGIVHSLVFTNVLYNDAGLYNCTAHNGVTPTSTNNIKVNVLYPPKIVNSYKWYPKEYSDNDITLACDVNASPAVDTITWTFEDKLLGIESHGVKIAGTAQGSVLYLTPGPNSDHTGTYACHATNSLGTAQELFYVTKTDMLMLQSSAPRAASLHHFTATSMLVSILFLLT